MPVDKTTSTFAKHRRIVFLLFSIVIVVAFVVSFVKGGNTQTTLLVDTDISQREVRTVSFPGSSIPDLHAWTATTSGERSRGLAVVDSLNSDQAMLFVFDTPGVYPFWMKNMKFPIDIMWLNEDREVVYIYQNAQPSDYPESYHPEAEALYVLEVVQGFTQQYGIKVGQSVAW